LILLLAYSLLLMLTGLWVGRRVKRAGDFFVAGRRLGPGLMFATFVAANIGGGSTVGATGLGYRDGISAWWWVGSAAIGSCVLGLTVGPRLYRIAREHDLRTVGDYLEHRYDPKVRAVVASLLWVGTLAILAGQLIALAWILNAVAGIPKWIGCVIGGVVVTSYSTAGGLLTSAWVNLVQVVVKLLGFAVALPMVLIRAGGLDGVVHASPRTAGYWSFWGGGAALSYVALLAPAFVVSPGLLQKIYGARDVRAVRVGVLGNALFLFVFAGFPPLLGIAAHSLHQSLSNPELALPTLLTSDLPLWVGGLGLAAVFSAEASAADAILFMLATSLSQDLYRRFVDPHASESRVLGVARVSAATGGLLAVGLAIVSPSITEALKIFYTLLSVSLFVPVMAGLYLPQVGPSEALVAIFCGIASTVAAHFTTGGAGVGSLSPALIGLLAAAASCAVVAGIRRRREW